MELNAASFKPDVMLRCHHIEWRLKRSEAAEEPVLETAQLLAQGKVGEGAKSALALLIVTYGAHSQSRDADAIFPCEQGNPQCSKMYKPFQATVFIYVIPPSICGVVRWQVSIRLFLHGYGTTLEAP